jgi:hypothetical protein
MNPKSYMPPVAVPVVVLLVVAVLLPVVQALVVVLVGLVAGLLVLVPLPLVSLSWARPVWVARLLTGLLGRGSRARFVRSPVRLPIQRQLGALAIMLARPGPLSVIPGSVKALLL